MLPFRKTGLSFLPSPSYRSDNFPLQNLIKLLHAFCLLNSMAKILILDDDKDLLTVFKSLLKKKGFDVFAYSEWSGAWNAVKAYKPHLILLDVFMKGIDGIDACKKLKASSFTRNIPIIMLSSYPDIADTAINESGADDFIAKPFETSEIIRKIQKLLLIKQPSA